MKNQQITMEEIITEEEIQIFRKPSDFELWFKIKLEATRKLKNGALKNEDLKGPLCHIGIAKDFYEEVFPLYILLKKFGGKWPSTEFRNVLGIQKYDVEVKNPPDDFPNKLEITVADWNHQERLRMEHYCDENRSEPVSLIGKVTYEGTRNTGRTIKVDNSLRPKHESIDEKKAAIKDAISNKCDKDYDKPIGLIVSFSDSFIFSKEDIAIMDTFLNNLDIPWRNKFTDLFIVGRSENIVRHLQ